MDTSMSESRNAGTQTSGSKRTRSAQDGASEVGQGHLVTVPRNIPHLFNNNYTVRLTYADNYVHVLNQDGTSAVQFFRTDSIFDPDATGGGHQPLLRDLWASQYDYYAVLACEYTIRLYVCNSASTTWTAVTPHGQFIGAINATLLKTTNASDATAINSGLIYPGAEMKNTITKFLPPDTMDTFSGTVTPGDFIIDAMDEDSDKTWTAVGSNPTTTRYIGYCLSTAQKNAISGVTPDPFTTIYAQVILNYDVQFTQMNQTLRTAPS